MLEQALKLASGITHPVSAAVFALVMAAFLFRYMVREKKSGTPKLRHSWVLGILAVSIITLGLAPLIASTFLQSRGIYRVRVVVVGPDQTPIEDAHVTSSVGGEPKKVAGGWEFDIPPQIRPADGKVTLFASVKNAFLSGSSMLVLTQDYYPTATIQISSDTSAMLRGVVVDEHLRSVAGATVSVDGYADVATTDNMGNFVLPAHAAEGQIVEVRAQKDQLAGSLSVPAGRVPVKLVVK